MVFRVEASVLESAAFALELLVEFVAEESSFGDCPALLGESEDAVSLVAGHTRCAECVVVVKYSLACALNLCNGGCRHRCLIGEDEAVEGTLEGHTEEHAAAEVDDEEEGGVDECEEEASLNGSSHVWREGDDGSYAEEDGDDASDDEYDGSNDEGAKERRHPVGRRALKVFEAQLSVLSRIGNHASDGFVFVVVVKHGYCLRISVRRCVDAAS